ncbi:hypothetical protein ACSBR1_021461 [Camellia fascicularis]
MMGTMNTGVWKMNIEKCNITKLRRGNGWLMKGTTYGGIIGDQWTSFEGLPAAKRTFKLPNSLYYSRGVGMEEGTLRLDEQT